MIVLDASAAVQMLAGEERVGDLVAERLEQESERAAPHLIDPEVSRGLRRLAQQEVIDVSDVSDLLRDLRDMRLWRFAHVQFLARVWELRASVGTYDAFYVALAELLECPLLTCDGRLARTGGHDATIELVS